MQRNTGRALSATASLTRRRVETRRGQIRHSSFAHPPARALPPRRLHSRASLPTRPSSSRPPPVSAASDSRGGGPLLLRRLRLGGRDAGRHRRRRGGGQLGSVGAAGAADRADRGGSGAGDDPIVVQGVASSAGDTAEVASDKEIGAVDASVAVPAERRRVSLAVDRRGAAAELACLPRLHLSGRGIHRSPKALTGSRRRV
ncbi:unnamed protein product [Musa acuminata subsp. burmannicoides]